jgi:hypothetical protein
MQRWMLAFGALMLAVAIFGHPGASSASSPQGNVAIPAVASSAPPAAPVANTICDAVAVGNLPNCSIYLAYVDGGYVTVNAVRQLHPTAQIITVSTTGATPANVLDVEPGNATPAEARVWVDKGYGHIIYSDIADKAALVRDLAGTYWLWYAADPSGCSRHLVAGSIATQYCWTGRYDISVTDGTWPTPPPAPAPSDSPL